MFHSNTAASVLRRSLVLAATLPTVFALSLALEPKFDLRAQVVNPLEGVNIPTELEPGSRLTIQSSEAMRPINEALQSRFSGQFANTDLKVDYTGSDQAVQSVIDGESDLAAIGRPITEAEKQAGVRQVPLSRHKIALVVGPGNPFSGSLTVEQFVKIFRGEITNWSQVGGPDVPIKLVDRPDISDTRQAFRAYPIFKVGPFQVGPGATRLSEDSTAAMVAELGNTGLGYAIADQVIDNPAVKIVPMHDTLPNDPRYPFSQPLGYVYRSDNPSAAALAFLGYAVNPDNEAAIEAARKAAAQAPSVSEPTLTPVPSPTVETPVVETPVAVATSRRFPWWPWLLALPLLGGLLWWLLKDRGGAAVPGDSRRLILTPRHCRDAYAYWELPESEVAALRRQNYPMALKLHDVTDIADVDKQPPHSTQQFTCDAVAVGDYHLPVGQDDRDYLVELGYLGANDSWHALARSSHVRVPACPNVGGALPTGAAVAGTAAAVAATAATLPAQGRVVFAARDCRHGYAYWELPQAQVNDLLAKGRSLRLRLYDVTELPGQVVGTTNTVQELEANLTAQGDLQVPVAVDDRDYLVELGYGEGPGHWHVLAKSEPVRVPACPDAATAAASVQGVSHSLTNPLAGKVGGTLTGVGTELGKSTTDVGQGVGNLAGAALAGGAAAVAGVGAAAGALFGKTTEAVQTVTSGLGAGSRTDMGAESKIILVPRGSDAAYAYWEVADVHRDALKTEGGRTLALRIHDATNLELDYQSPHSTQEYLLAEADQDKHVPIFVPDRDYVAELGYLTDQGDWLQLIRSLHVRVPAA